MRGVQEQESSQEAGEDHFERAGELIVEGGLLLIASLPLCIGLITFVQSKRRDHPGWKIASLIFGLFGLLTVSCTALVISSLPEDYANTAPPAEIVGSTADGELFTSSDQRYRLSVRGNWRGTAGLLEGSTLELCDDVAAEYFAAFSYTEGEFPDGLEACAEYFTEHYLTDSEENVLISRATTQADGYDAVRVVINANFGGDLMVQLLFMVEVEDAFYLLIGWGYRENAQQVVRDLDRLFATFEVVEE